MADRFEDLGIGPELAAGVEALGWEAPAGIQSDALPVIRRGNNVVLHASSGSGAVGAYGLGILDRLHRAEEESGSGSDSAPRALVLVPDDDTASRTADSLARLAAPAGLTARAHGAGWTDRPVDVLVLSPAAASAAVRDSRLKLDGLAAVVIDGLDLMDATGQWEELETMIDIVPGSAQRVIVTGSFPDAVGGFIERHARKALNVPPRVEAEPGSGGPTIRYRVVPENGKGAVVVAQIVAAEAGEVAVVCRTQDRAEALETALRARGIVLGDDDGAPRVLVLPSMEADQRSTQANVISADVPFDADTLLALHGRGGVILVTPREKSHLQRIARRAGATLQPLPDDAPAATSPATLVRDRIRALIGTADLAADLALIEPLLDEHPAAEVAAAALYLARTGATQNVAGAPAGAPAPSAGRAAAPRPGAGAPPPSDATTWTHLFISIGSRDDVGPGDLVGAMTGEAGVSGDQVGKIDIRESHTTVEVATPVAETVIQALNGRTLKGRSLRVDYDRKARPSRGPDDRTSGGRGGPSRGGPSRGGSSRGGGPRGGSGGRRPSGGRGPTGGRKPSGGGKPPRRG